MVNKPILNKNIYRPKFVSHEIQEQEFTFIFFLFSSFKYIIDESYTFEDWPVDSRAERRDFMPQIEKLESLTAAIEQGRECST